MDIHQYTQAVFLGRLLFTHTGMQILYLKVSGFYKSGFSGEFDFGSYSVSTTQNARHDAVKINWRKRVWKHWQKERPTTPHVCGSFCSTAPKRQSFAPSVPRLQANANFEAVFYPFNKMNPPFGHTQSNMSVLLTSINIIRSQVLVRHEKETMKSLGHAAKRSWQHGTPISQNIEGRYDQATKWN